MRAWVFVGAVVLSSACGSSRHQVTYGQPDAAPMPVGTLRGQILFTDGTATPVSANVIRDITGGNTALVAEERTIQVMVNVGWHGPMALDPGTYYYQMNGGAIVRNDMGMSVAFQYPDEKQPQNIVDASPTSATLTVQQVIPPHFIGSIDAVTDAAHLMATFDVTLNPLM
jgi:hypothetical protein